MSAPFACPVRAHAAERPEATALPAPGGTWTYADLDARADALAADLATLGPPGTRTAVYAANGPALVALVWAAFRARHLLVLVPPRWPEAMAHEAAARARVAAFLTGDGAGGFSPAALATPAARSPIDGPGVVVFTSGSTGAPKGAVLPADALVANAEGVAAALGLGPRDRWLLDLPLVHVGGLGVAVRCALAGAAAVLPDRGTPTAEAIAAHGVTHASLVTTQLHRMLAHGAAPPPSLRAVLLGGSAIPPALLDAAHGAGWPVHTSYGLTEMGSTVTMTPPGAARADLATSGPPLPGRAVSVRDGEIVVGGPSRFAGYLDDGLGDGLARPFDADGTFATGDLGFVDDRGRLHVTGRRGLRFVSGGENVQPEAVEAALLALPGVARAAVVPVADAEFGHRPVAFVEMATGEAPDADVVRAALAERLPGFMRPVAVYPWPPGPEGMKVDRGALRAEAERRRREGGGA